MGVMLGNVLYAVMELSKSDLKHDHILLSCVGLQQSVSDAAGFAHSALLQVSAWFISLQVYKADREETGKRADTRCSTEIHTEG